MLSYQFIYSADLIKNEIILYQPNELAEHIEVKIDEETVWLTLNQIAKLFSRDKSVISRHLRNIFKEGELVLEATVAKNATVQIEAGREVKREKANEQYGNFEIQEFSKSHDRFLIIDHSGVYHLGASLKDLGRKWFAFSKFDKNSVENILAYV